MVKIVCSLLIIISIYSIGYIFSYRYTLRADQLKNIYYSIQLLETEIFYSSNPLPYAMEQVKEKSAKAIAKIFGDTGELLQSKCGLSVHEAWCKSVYTNIYLTSLEKEDCEILINFGKGLGTTDKENQKKNFQFLYMQLQKQYELAEELKIKNGKMYRSLGFLMGIGLVILFI